MAWYTSRIGSNQNGTETSHSARSLNSSGGGMYFNLSSRSYDTSKTTSVRYVNSAALLENNMPLTDVSHVSYVNNSTMSETQSDIVPPLDLKSEENYPTNRDYTFSYHKHYEAPKIVLNPNQAYETWLSAKKKLLSDEANRRKKAEELKRREIEERKRLAKEQYEKWLEKKSHTSISQQSIPVTSSKVVNNWEQRSQQLSSEEAQFRLEEWNRSKRLEEERRRMLKRQEEERRRELEQQRRQLAVEAWEKWIANADKKPKPVPLNRGIFTLRGTVSDIFVNPNEWKSVVPTNKKEV
ncbi:uncharacterized protein ACRADG_009254 [Cochliomyia hominivorax]